MKYDLTCEVRDLEPGMTVRGVLRREKGLSTRLIRKMKNGSGGVWLNGGPARFNTPVKEGDMIGLVYPEETSGFEPQDIPIKVIYEDEDILALDKGPGFVVHPTKGHSDGTIANGVMKYIRDRGESWRIRFINRLDRDTSGVLLIGKNSRAQSEFARQADSGRIEKRYFAIVEGVPEKAEGTIDLPIGLANEGEVNRTVREDGYPSVTHYRTLGAWRPGYSLLEILLGSGRTHQIRVHLSHMGHPVVGDTLYGRASPGLIGRQALHAASLRFRHPSRLEEIEISAPPPMDMRSLLEKIGGCEGDFSLKRGR